MSNVVQQHLARLKAATIKKLGRKDLPEWIEKNTFINGRHFSFLGHEYQKRILLEDSPDIVIRKSAQTGISEMSMRMAAALVMIMPGSFRIGYTMPTATAATNYAKTRFNLIVNTSPALRSAISSADIDSADTRTFGPGKEIYFKGAAVGNAAISTTLDMLIKDEVSFSSAEVLGDYTSRLIHSPYKWQISLSTPTYPGDQIDEAFQASRRHWNFCRCQHCGHRFVPDYYANIKIPGWDKPLDEITKDNLHLVRFQEAQFLCSSCWRPTSLAPENREWVCENPGEGFVSTGFQVQPFDAPTVVTPPDLVLASTKYANKAKFKQFSLGVPAADADSGITEEDLARIGVESASTPFSTHVMGIDVGRTLHIVIGSLDSAGRLGVVHYERVPLAQFRERYFSLKAEYRVILTVMDIQPFTDLVMSLSQDDPNLYGATYTTRQGMELFDVRQRDTDPDNALVGVRQVSLNRNAVFDRLLADIRGDRVWVRKRTDWELYKTHLQDMKRAASTLRSSGEFTSVWQKSSKGNDHYHHATSYAWVAAQMRGIASGALSSHGPAVSTFRLRRG
jgi:DNA-directed RNA polymerase subunit RPC12/RpoP